MIIPPYYCVPTEDELFHHYKTVADAIGIPIMVYNNPATANVDLLPATLARLSTIPNCRYVKEARWKSPACATSSRALRRPDGGFAGVLGYESAWLGAIGWVAVCSNVVPRLSRDMFAAAAFEADREQGAAAVPRARPAAALGRRPPRYVSGTKAAFRLMGMEMGPPRPPRLPLPERRPAGPGAGLAGYGRHAGQPRRGRMRGSRDHAPPPAVRRRACGRRHARLSPRNLRDRRVPDSELVKPRTLTLSTNPTLPPMQYVNAQGQLVGMRVDLGAEIARRLCLSVEHVRVEFAAMIPGLAARRWDMINTGMFYTEERAKLMYLVRYEEQAISISVPRGNPRKITKFEDLAGLTVGVEQGGFEFRRTQDIAKALEEKGLKPITIRPFDNFAGQLPVAAGRPARRRRLHRQHGQGIRRARRLHPGAERAVRHADQFRPAQQGAGPGGRGGAGRDEGGWQLRRAARSVWREGL